MIVTINNYSGYQGIKKKEDATSTQITERYAQESQNNTILTQNLGHYQSRQQSDANIEQFNLYPNDIHMYNTPKKQQNQNTEFIEQSNEILKNSKINITTENVNIITRKLSSSTIVIKKMEEQECKYCRQIDSLYNFIRPCLCKGSMQHVHQQCVQKDIESNFMDENQRKFIKPIRCEICQFVFKIKIYREINLLQSFKDPNKHEKLLFLSFVLIILTLIMIGLVILSILIKEELRMHIDLLMGIVIAFLIVLGLMIAFSLNFIDLITNYYWFVLDRQIGNKVDNGIQVDYQSLNLILLSGTLKYQWKKSQVLPLNE
ncbi:unnamed protein product [Paramecium primaurelia]|uniref:RING-CH-type domain-containing protein n=1 Tax=Paramecium primaurelia TaxID=5886 RepID=A0A8S1LG16_PARPR|nr:unnamed protein product [Paramecium primaurelia]